MEYCGERGLPHSQFLEWDEEDRAKVLAWVYENSLRCPSCGTAEWEWEQNKFAYHPVERICRGCELKELGRSDTDHAGVYVTLEPQE